MPATMTENKPLLGLLWHPDPGAEQLMRAIGMTFRYEEAIPLKQLKLKESLKNNARSLGGALDDDLVQKYAYDMSQGVAFPAIVLTAGYVILAGNQRANAAGRSGRTTISAYLVEPCSEEKVDDFVRRDNTRHGKPLSEEEKIQTCVQLNMKYGRPLRELAKQFFGGNDKMYYRIVNAHQAKVCADRLVARHVMTERLTTGHMIMMNPLKDDSVLAATAQLALDYSLSTVQTDKLVAEICEKGSEAERKTVVSQKRVELESLVNTGKVGPEVVFRKQILSFHKFLNGGCSGSPFPALARLVPDRKQQMELREAIDSIISQLKRLKEKVR